MSCGGLVSSFTCFESQQAAVWLVSGHLFLCAPAGAYWHWRELWPTLYTWEARVCTPWGDANRVPSVGSKMAFNCWQPSLPFQLSTFLRAFFQGPLWKSAQKTGMPSWSYNPETWDEAPESKGCKLWGREGSMTSCPWRGQAWRAGRVQLWWPKCVGWQQWCISSDWLGIPYGIIFINSQLFFTKTQGFQVPSTIGFKFPALLLIYYLVVRSSGKYQAVLEALKHVGFWGRFG